jgi:type IV secretory pathway ATPase VirB11/archaellum biosynthesis ATPase
MEISSLQPIYNENEKGTQWKLISDCEKEKCKKKSHKECINCIANLLIKTGEKRIGEIFLSDLPISNQEIEIIYSLISIWKKIKESVKNLFDKCEMHPSCSDHNLLIHKLCEFELSEFVDILESLLSEKIRQIPSSLCRICEKDFLKVRKISIKNWNKSKLKEIFNSKYGTNDFKSDLFYSMMNFIRILKSNDLELDHDKNYQLIHRYIYFEDVYIAHIFQNQESYLKYYRIQLFNHEFFADQLRYIGIFIGSKIHGLIPNNLFSLGDKIEQLSFLYRKFVEIYFPKFSDQIKTQISLLITIEYLHLQTIFPLLVDPFIEEIFLDSKNDFIYINHQKYGRCQTFYHLNFEEIEALKTHLRIESSLRLDENQNSLIHVISNQYFNCRFSIDIAPTHWKNIGIDIRKMNKNIFTLFDLLKLETLNIEMAAFLVFCILLRVNITIVGEVDSGKTTLMNALDLFVPQEYRKIYIEETIETLEIPVKYGHQLKYRSSKTNIANKKENEINRLLHRSGEVIFLGEILDSSETKAMFHCLSAGLTGFQTTHAASVESLIRRWLIHFGISKDCLNDLGLIVYMKKINNMRKILSISEILWNQTLDKIEIHRFWNYYPEKKQWIKEFLIDESKLFQIINTFIYFPIRKFEMLQILLTNFFQKALEINQIKIYNPIGTLKEDFHKILRG